MKWSAAGGGIGGDVSFGAAFGVAESALFGSFELDAWKPGGNRSDVNTQHTSEENRDMKPVYVAGYYEEAVMFDRR